MFSAAAAAAAAVGLFSRQNEPSARKTKIVCTLGPSSWSEEGLSKLIDAGMNVARFNFSHGDHAGHKEVLDRLRKVRYLFDCLVVFAHAALGFSHTTP